MIRAFAFLVLFGFPLVQGSAVGIHLQGSKTIWDRWAVDLDVDYTLIDDSNDDSPPDPAMSFEGSDFWFGWDGKAERLHPQHHAKLAKGSSAELGFLGCSKATYAKGEIRIDDLPVGSHICVHTNEGRYSELRIESFDRKKKTITISFTTWVKNSSDSIYQPR
jgi:hypothetical protein